MPKKQPSNPAAEGIDKPILEHNRCGFINEFLWTCAGVNKQVLRQCPSDYAKYAGIGGTILFTALMAALSGGYALNFVFDNQYVAIAFGIFWGLLIFNLDRFIVNTMYSDGKHTISWGEIKSGLPRIIMAIFLGIVISTPLELRIFEDGIKMQIEKDKQNAFEERIQYLKDEIAKNEEEIAAIQSGVGEPDSINIHTGNIRIDALTDSINKTQPILNSVQDQINDKLAQKAKLDREDESYSEKKAAIGRQLAPLYARRSTLSSKIKRWKFERAEIREKNGERTTIQTEERKNRIRKLQADNDSLKRCIAEARTVHKEWSRERRLEEGSVMDKIDIEYNGFKAQFAAFQQIRKKEPSTNVAAWFIMLLFVIIETAPTFFKMMMEDGPYDDLLKAEKHRVRVLSQKRISDVNDQINTDIRISTAKNKQRLEAEAIANEDVLKRIAEAQAEILQVAIDAWRQAELEKVKADPAAYIKQAQPPKGNKS